MPIRTTADELSLCNVEYVLQVGMSKLINLRLNCWKKKTEFEVNETNHDMIPFR